MYERVLLLWRYVAPVSVQFVPVGTMTSLHPKMRLVLVFLEHFLLASLFALPVLLGHGWHVGR